MPLYPSLEDMNVHQMAGAQAARMAPPAAASASVASPSAPPSYTLHPTAPSAVPHGGSAALYPSLDDYMGFDLKALRDVPEVAHTEGERAVVPRPLYGSPALISNSNHSAAIQPFCAPVSGSSVGLVRAHVSHGVREVRVCKNAAGKIGLKARAIHNGIFVQLVEKNSPAALAGIRFGDQILQIDGENVAGYSVDKTHKIFKNCAANGIRIAIRDRPFERNVTLHKSSGGLVGFQFKDGKVISIAKDSSAARNGLLTDHNLLEVDGQNVVGLKDKEITKIIQSCGDVVTLTIMPTVLFEHIMKEMSFSLVKSSMDHGVRDF